MVRVPSTPRAAESPADDSSALGWVVSLAFWFCLLVALLAYAAADLAPKLLTSLELRQQHYAAQVRLVALEQQATHLRRVRDALEHDPAYAAELARVDFDAARPGDESIAVGPGLALDTRQYHLGSLPPAPPLPWYAPLLETVVESRRIRYGLLGFAALLVVLAFTFLQDTHRDRITAGATTLGSCARALGRRYRRAG